MGATKKSDFCRSRGFTIIEFMVATTVFGFITLAASTAITQIGREYKRSMNASSTQAATRNLVDTVAHAIQYSSDDVVSAGPAADGTRSFCMGTKQFLYVFGRRVDVAASVTTAQQGAIVRPNSASCAVTQVTTTLPSGSVGLLGRGMRLVDLTVAAEPGSPSLHRVYARVAYGADDLLCSPGIAAGTGSCAPNSAQLSTAQLTGADAVRRKDLICRPGAGSEFCSVSSLSVVVQRRL